MATWHICSNIFNFVFSIHFYLCHMERYLTGLLTDLPHKTCDTIADVIAGTSVERLQHLLTDAAWDPLALDEARVKRLLALHPVSDGILVFDDTGLPKKGSTSVGVAPQYSGTLGKIGNCQVVVSAEYLADDPASSTPFHWPVSARLFLQLSSADEKRPLTCVSRPGERANKARVKHIQAAVLQPQEMCKNTTHKISFSTT